MATMKSPTQENYIMSNCSSNEFFLHGKSMKGSHIPNCVLLEAPKSQGILRRVSEK